MNTAVSEVLFYAAHQTRWYTDNIKMWLAEIEGHSSSEEDEARRQNLRDEIRAFFELILEYIMRATGHINKAALAKAAKAVVQPNSWWKQGLDKLKDRRVSLEEHLKLSADQKEKRRKRISAQTKLISAFKPDPAVDMPGVLHLHSNRAPHTCRWFRKHPTFDKWWHGGGADHLLVSADPGSGKTTLSAYLVQKVLPKYFPKAIVTYYFFDYASTSRQDLAPALSSLLYQLFRAKRELADDHEDAIEGDETSVTGLGGIDTAYATFLQGALRIVFHILVASRGTARPTRSNCSKEKAARTTTRSGGSRGGSGTRANSSSPSTGATCASCISPLKSSCSSSSSRVVLARARARRGTPWTRARPNGSLWRVACRTSPCGSSRPTPLRGRSSSASTSTSRASPRGPRRMPCLAGSTGSSCTRSSTGRSIFGATRATGEASPGRWDANSRRATSTCSEQHETRS